MKKVLSIVLSIVMVLCMIPAMAFADTATYSDIAGTACEAAVEELSELGVVSGYPDGTYKPAAVVTRAEMAKLIVTALGLNPTAGTTAFTDMNAASWAIPYVGYAESLGIIEGYGNGLFGPNDTVTYDQAITMVVRALGYTEACNEMQGVWPAVFVQKANELAILKGVSTGATGATRGDVAVLLNNALAVPMVYADKEGETIAKTPGVTMYDLLIGEVTTTYGVVTEATAAAANKNIRALVGAAGTILTNEDGDVISVSDVKTTFLTGEFQTSGAEFKAVDGTVYKVKGLKKLDAEGKAVTATTIPSFTNGAAGQTTINAAPTSGKYTIAATVSGKNINIYSVQVWNNPTADVIEKLDLDTLAKKDTLLGNAFVMTEAEEIDTNSFIIEGATSLDDIAVDNVVYVYTANSKVTKVSVGTTIVEGVYEEVNTAKGLYTIAGKAYEKVAACNISVSLGDTVKAYLDYAGDIYKVELVNDSTTTAVVLRKADGNGNSNLLTESKNAVVRVLTAAGEYVTYKLDEEVFGYDADEFTTATIVKLAFNADGEVKAVTPVNFTATHTTKDVTAAGYFEGTAIADSAVIFKVGSATVDNSAGYEDKNVTVLAKSDVVGAEDITANVVVEEGLITVMKVTSGLTKSDAVYGIITGQSETNRTSKEWNVTALVDGAVVTYVSENAIAANKMNVFAKITLNGTEITNTESVNPITDGYTVTDNDVISGVVVNNTVNGKSFNASAVVYVKAADGTWSVGSASDIADAKLNNVIWMFDTEEVAKVDKVADVVVVVK